MFPILGERGWKFKVAWRTANVRTAVPYFKITKKAAKQTIPFFHRYPRCHTIPFSLQEGTKTECRRKDLIYRNRRADAAESASVLLNSHSHRIYRNELVLPEGDITNNIVIYFEEKSSICMFAAYLMRPPEPYLI